MSRHSLQREIWLALVILASTSVLMLTATTFITSERLEQAFLEQTISDELAFVQTRLQENPDLRLPRSGSLQVWLDADGHVYAPLDFRQLPLGSHHGFDYLQTSWHVLRKQTPQGLLTIAIDVSLIEARERQMSLALIVAGALVIGGALIVGWWLSLRLAEPTSRLAHQLRAIEPDDATPMANDFTSHEVRDIAAAADDLRQRQFESITHERLFSAAASHELRTPLATISSSLELLNLEPLGDAGKARLARANRASAGLVELVRSLIFLARPSATHNTSRQRLQPIIESAVEAVRAIAPQAGILTQYKDDPILNTDAALLRILLSNLLRNAVQHGSPNSEANAAITVTLNTSQLEVADNGPGMSAYSLEDVLKPYVSGDPGNRDRFGLGLYIVHRICQHLDWTLSYKPCDGDKGSRFIVSFTT